jgi:hypothetical protein
VLLAIAFAACNPPPLREPSRLTAPPEAPPEIHAACRLAVQRCTRCHPIERVLLARVESPQHWEYYVARMRRQPRSGISEEDGRVIARCLVARSFGLAALEGLP